MLPHARRAKHVAACWVPVHIRNTIMVRSIHMLQVRSEIFLALRLLSFEIQIPEVEIEALL